MFAGPHEKQKTLRMHQARWKHLRSDKIRIKLEMNFMVKGFGNYAKQYPEGYDTVLKFPNNSLKLPKSELWACHPSQKLKWTRCCASQVHKREFRESLCISKSYVWERGQNAVSSHNISSALSQRDMSRFPRNPPTWYATTENYLVYLSALDDVTI